jgi:hypothetical protein
MSIQPPADTGVCKDNNITLISAATGSPTSTVQWQIMPKNSSTWSNISGATNPNLTLTSVGQNDDGNRYQVIYTNLCGSVTSNVTTLHVGAPVNVGFIPDATVYGCDNFGSVTLTAEANGGNGLVVMVWQVSTDGGTTWSDIPGTTSTSLIGNFSTSYTFTPTIGQMGYKFRAQFSNAGCDAAFSNISSLNIVLTPTVTLDPLANQIVCRGSSTAQENFTGTNATAYNWTNDNTAIGLVASGSAPVGSPFIPAFVALNPGNTPITANITVTPVNSSGATCPAHQKHLQ